MKVSSRFMKLVSFSMNLVSNAVRLCGTNNALAGGPGSRGRKNLPSLPSCEIGFLFALLTLLSASKTFLLRMTRPTKSGSNHYL
jgi:hypothetical protein